MYMLSKAMRRICYKNGVPKPPTKNVKRLIGERVRELRLAHGYARLRVAIPGLTPGWRAA
jgi:hypothetical protein